MIVFFKESVLVVDFIVVLCQVVVVGNFINVYIGYVNKMVVFFNFDGIFVGYDFIGCFWYL